MDPSSNIYIYQNLNVLLYKISLSLSLSLLSLTTMYTILNFQFFARERERERERREKIMNLLLTEERRTPRRESFIIMGWIHHPVYIYISRSQFIILYKIAFSLSLSLSRKTENLYYDESAAG
jgi:hypothetical protein